MNDQQDTPLSLLKGLAETATGIPEPIKKSFFKAASDLLGGIVSIPAAKLKQIAQSIDDTTKARSIAAELISKKALDIATNDPEIISIAADIYLPSIIRKSKNRMRVAQFTAEHLEEASKDSTGEEAQTPEDDWMNYFMRHSEDASSERLQDLFGRILAGQIVRPGRFGLSTLRALSELDQEIAEDFAQAWKKSVGESVDYSPEWQRGEGFSRWKRLSEVGLMAPASTAQYLPDYKPLIEDLGAWSPVNVDNLYVIVFFKEHSNVSWTHIDFTKIGREIGSLLPRPNYEENMKAMVTRLPKEGIAKIDLIKDGSHTENLWRTS